MYTHEHETSKHVSCTRFSAFDMQGLPSGSLAMTVLLRSTPPFLSSVQQYTHTSRICDSFFFFLYIKYILLHSSFLFYLFFFFLSIFIFFIQKDLETSQRAFFNIQLSWYLLLFFLFLYFLVIFRFEWIREQRSFGNFAIYVWFYV